MLWDVIIVGGGPAGLSAALVLGRCRRKVLVIDEGKPRNSVSRKSHGYFTRDGARPSEFLRIGREQLRPYGVALRPGVVVEVSVRPSGFELRTEDGKRERARKVLLATGIRDRLPQLEGLPPLYGRSVFHCPYCDGWEVRDKPLAAYARGGDGPDFALGLTTWSRDVVLLTDGARRVSVEDARRLKRNGVGIRFEKILRLEGDGGLLRRVHFMHGKPLERSALFFHSGVEQRSKLPADLGCLLTTSSPASSRRRTSPGSTSRETARGTCSSSSSLRPRERRRPLESTKRCAGRASGKHALAGATASGLGSVRGAGGAASVDRQGASVDVEGGRGRIGGEGRGLDRYGQVPSLLPGTSVQRSLTHLAHALSGAHSHVFVQLNCALSSASFAALIATASQQHPLVASLQSELVAHA
jgi:thioredoxin reductase